jgi:hypothetical protein
MIARREYLLEVEPAVVHYEELVGGGPSFAPATGS